MDPVISLKFVIKLYFLDNFSIIIICNRCPYKDNCRKYSHLTETAALSETSKAKLKKITNGITRIILNMTNLLGKFIFIPFTLLVIII